MFPLVAIFASAAHAADTVYDYRGPAGEGRFTAAQIAGFLRANASVLHEVRRDGFEEWVDATHVPEIAWEWLRSDASIATGAMPAGEPPAAAPTETRPAPVEPPPLEPAEAPTEPERAERPAVRGVGELWVNVSADAAGGDAVPAVRKAAVGLAAEGGAFTARVLVGGESPDTVRIEDAWLQVGSSGSVRGWARLGVARPGFGVADSFEEGRRYWVAGRSAELERRSGWLPQSSAGLAAGAEGARWSASVELADAAAAEPAPSFDALETRGRGLVGLGGTPESPLVRVGASVAWRAPLADSASSRLLGAVHAELSAGPVQLLAEGMAGTEGEAGVPLAGGLAALAVNVPIRAPAFRTFSVVLAGGGWDSALTGLPESEDVPDAWYEGRAGANLTWNLPATRLVTGVGYLLDVPQDLALPVEQTVVGEAAWQF